MKININFNDLWLDANKLAAAVGGVKFFNFLEQIHHAYESTPDKELALADLFEAFKQLKSMQFDLRRLKLHSALFTLLICLGQDIFQLAKANLQYLTLACFYELKFKKQWGNWQFYSMMSGAIKYIRKNLSFFTPEVSVKLEQEYQVHFPDDYSHYFRSAA